MRISTAFLHKPTVTTQFILYSSACAGVVILFLLAISDLSLVGHLQVPSITGIGALIYLSYALIILRYYHSIRVVGWMVLILYTSLSLAVLLCWGLNTTPAILAISFVIIVAGALFGSRTVLPVTICISLLLLLVQIAHSTKFIIPDHTMLVRPSSFLDVLTYVTIFSVFSLVTWVANKHLESTLHRVRRQEAATRATKETVTLKLERESTRLREAQMKEMQHLYKFAMLGQTAAATLHELSNHLSVLNMDIDDLKQQNKNSKAIANAKEGITQINLMVRQIRQKLNSYETTTCFDCIPTIRSVVKNQRASFRAKDVSLEFINTLQAPAFIQGDPYALMQAITILLHNAREACAEHSTPRVILRIDRLKDTLTISVIDNGPGMSSSAQESIFLPRQSSKPHGLGIGLYLAKHLVETQFKGSIRLVPPSGPDQYGGHFSISMDLQTDKVSADSPQSTSTLLRP